MIARWTGGPLRLTVGLILIGVPACAAENGERDERGDPGRADGSEEVRGGGDGAPDAAASDRPICLRGEPFVASGAIPVAGADATTSGRRRAVSALRWEPHDGCERFVIDLDSDDGPPATAGAVSAELLRDMRVVRVHLRDAATATDATDADFDGPLASGAYSVHAPDDRGIYVDLHLDQAAEAHVTRLTDPARVVVDLRPGGPRLSTPPARGRRVVILEPRPGAASYPLMVTGYARTFEANVVARLMIGDEVVRETFTTSTGWLEAWGDYSMTIPDGPSGTVELQVGEHSARDGSWEGVSVELEIR